ncbi:MULTISPECIES: hypothetical protein [Mycolicibacter]|uniref:Uncharacterized protein n=2 Tax=Mycolicibacter TaxID=1073531 RepID=A0ABU5XM55_9MYCO|nr:MULTISPECIES: hypothetical protein [unclassified Mycolicibacter]MEB3023347.1 hypothetical protein [Mycolicibacter sp. MYC098]MEB3033689.1 hypothetical protein [Mycolicibacter sp. MYC340]
MGTPNARKSAARRYQREHPGTTYPQALRAVTADIVICLPARDDNPITAGLREITRAIQALEVLPPQGKYAAEILEGNWPQSNAGDFNEFAADLFGGADGYGEDWSNTTFTMRPYDYGDCTCGQESRIEEWSASHSHTPECTQTEIQAVQGKFTGTELREQFAQLKSRLNIPDQGAMWHCTCGVEDAYQTLLKNEHHSPRCEPFLPNFVYHPTGAEIRWYKYIGRGMEITGDLPEDFATHCVRSIQLTREGPPSQAH